jgi:hypothetical protein
MIKEIEGFPNYFVREDGTVFTGHGKELKILRPYYTRRYWWVRLCCKGRRRAFGVHCLVLECFVGPRPPGMQGRHLDGNRDHNYLENLAWGTPKENHADCLRHGTRMMGSKHHRSKLNEEQVAYIRSRRQKSRTSESILTQKELADRFSVSTSSIRHIWIGDGWSQVQ